MEEVVSPIDRDPYFPVQPRSIHVPHRSLLSENYMMGDDTFPTLRDDPYSARDFAPDSSFPRYLSWLPPSAAHAPFSPSDPYSPDYPDAYRLPYYSPGHTLSLIHI